MLSELDRAVSASRDLTLCQVHISPLVRHTLSGYRDAIFDVDLSDRRKDEWYAQNVMVRNARYTTYVAEHNLIIEPNPIQIAHLLLSEYFSAFNGTRYLKNRKAK